MECFNAGIDGLMSGISPEQEIEHINPDGMTYADYILPRDSLWKFAVPRWQSRTGWRRRLYRIRQQANSIAHKIVYTLTTRSLVSASFLFCVNRVLSRFQVEECLAQLDILFQQ